MLYLSQVNTFLFILLLIYLLSKFTSIKQLLLNNKHDNNNNNNKKKAHSKQLIIIEVVLGQRQVYAGDDWRTILSSANPGDVFFFNSGTYCIFFLFLFFLFFFSFLFVVFIFLFFYFYIIFLIMEAVGGTSYAITKNISIISDGSATFNFATGYSITMTSMILLIFICI